MDDLPKFGDGICLARVDRLLGALNIDRGRLAADSIVVTGSNGKGSTAAFCEAMARAHGLSTGLFTSPHLFAYAERFRLNGIPVEEQALRSARENVASAIERIGRAGFGAFEAQLAVACLLFMDANCDLMIFEAGIGGRYDPVRNVLSSVTAVTSIDLEHTSLLGHSLELIVLDKSDACRHGGTIVYGANCYPLGDLIKSYNVSRGVGALFLGEDLSYEDVRYFENHQTYRAGIAELSFEVSTALLGPFQVNNSLIAAALLREWLSRQDKFSDRHYVASVQQGAKSASLPGRMETICDEPLVVVDVGHTPDAIRQALASLKSNFPSRRWLCVVGVSRDKEVQKIVDLIAPEFDHFICTKAFHKGAPVEAVRNRIASQNPRAHIAFAGDLVEASAAAIRFARELDWSVVVLGGLFLAAEFSHALGGKDPRSLQFF